MTWALTIEFGFSRWDADRRDIDAASVIPPGEHF